MKPMNHIELRKSLIMLGWTQKKLSEMLCVSERIVHKWLVTGVTNPAAAMLIRVMVARKDYEKLLHIGWGGTA